MTDNIDPVCLVHGLRMSEHDCLYCCLCFEPLTFEQCNILPSGEREDVCVECAKMEREMKLLGYPNIISRPKP